MKRSEMINLIDDYVSYSSRPRAEAILAIIENAGMLPPETEVEMFMFGPVYKNEWDKE